MQPLARLTALLPRLIIHTRSQLLAFELVLFEGLDLIAQLEFGAGRVVLDVVLQIVRGRERLPADGGLAAGRGQHQGAQQRHRHARRDSVPPHDSSLSPSPLGSTHTFRYRPLRPESLEKFAKFRRVVEVAGGRNCRCETRFQPIA